MAHEKEHQTIMKLVEAWKKYDQNYARHGADRLASDMPRFIDYAWDSFDTKQVLTVLLSSEPTYGALKPILFAGFCTWNVCPEQKSLRQRGMLLVAVEHLQRAEIFGRAAVRGYDVPHHELLGDILGRVSGLGPDFYSDFYYPVGGFTRIMRSAIPDRFAPTLAKLTKDVYITVAMMETFDLHAKHMNDQKRYYKASDSKGFEVIRRIHGEERGEIHIDLGKLEKIWKLSRETAAITYAASTIAISKHKTLLDIICAGAASYEKHGHYLEIWVRRARYAAEIILGRSTRPEVGLQCATQLPEIGCEPTPEPQFTASELAWIKGEFDIAAILGNRKPNVRRQRMSRRGPRRV